MGLPLRPEETLLRLVANDKSSKKRSVYLSPQTARTGLAAYLRERPQVSSKFVFLSCLEEGGRELVKA